MKGFEQHVEDKIEGIKNNMKAEETRLNNVIEGLEKQLKTKYDSDKYVLVEREKLSEVMDNISCMGSSAEDLENEITNIKYQELEYVVGDLEEASNNAYYLKEDCNTHYETLENMLKEEEEEKTATEYLEQIKLEAVIDSGNLGNVTK